MSLLLNYSVYDYECFSDDLPAVSDMTYVEVGQSIIDELMIRTKTDQGNTDIRETWNNDTVLLAKFASSLEAGNINNDGVKIVSFKIKRKLVTDLDSIDVGDVMFSGNTNYDFYDYTQKNGNNLYTVIPIGENGLDGVPFDTTVASSFEGTWLVDKDTNNMLVFDKALSTTMSNTGSIADISTSFSQSRVLIETFNKFPQVFYTGDTSFESFTLSTVLIPDDGDKSYSKYLDVLNKFINDHKPKLLKFDNGKAIIVDVSNPRTTTPMTTWDGFDYIILSVDVVEVDSYENYFSNE